MANRLPLRDRLRDHPLMGPEDPTCRFCGDPFVPGFDGQLYCDEDCEFIDRKIDEAEQRREERCDDCCALPSFCECNTALNYESEEEEV